MFFFLVQTEQGDIFKITLETEDEMVSLNLAAMQTPPQITTFFNTCAFWHIKVFKPIREFWN